MAREVFNKNEAFVAGCFLASSIDGLHDGDENKMIYTTVMLNGEKMALKVNHDTYYRKWNYFMASGGLKKIEKEVIATLKKCSADFVKKVLAYMENVTYASKNNDEDKWQDSNEEALINRFSLALNVSRSEISKLRKKLY